MWKKRSIKTEHSYRGYSVIQQGVAMKGTLTADGPLYIDGHIEGDLMTTEDVVIGPNGRLKGTLRAGSLRLAGVFQGDAYVKGRVHLSHTAQLIGTLQYGALAMEEGAALEGTVRRMLEEKENDRSTAETFKEPVPERIERTERLKERIRPQGEREKVQAEKTP